MNQVAKSAGGFQCPMRRVPTTCRSRVSQYFFIPYFSIKPSDMPLFSPGYKLHIWPVTFGDDKLSFCAPPGGLWF